jgi:hypothetical protein
VATRKLYNHLCTTFKLRRDPARCDQMYAMSAD